MVPGVVRRGVEELHEPHAAFDEPPGQQALPAEQCPSPALSMPYSLCVAALSRERSNASGASRCMRNASSNDAMRASSWLSIVAAALVELVQPAEGIELRPLAVERRRAGSRRLAIGFFRSRTSVPW